MYSVAESNPDGDLARVRLLHFSAKICRPYFCKGDFRSKTWSEDVQINSALLSRSLPFEKRNHIGIVSVVRVNMFSVFRKSEPMLAFEVSAQIFYCSALDFIKVV